MTETIENLFIYIATYSSLLPVLLFLGSYFVIGKTKNNQILNLAICYSAVEFAVNFSTFWISPRVIRTIYSFFTAAEYTFFAYILFLLIRDRLSKKILLYLSIGFYVFWAVYKLTRKDRFLDSVPIGVETILILLFSFRFLFEQMDKVEDGFIYNRFSFWVVAGIMLYLSGSLFCYLYANQVDAKTTNVFWMFQNAFATLKCIFFTLSLIVYRKQLYSNRKVLKHRSFI